MPTAGAFGTRIHRQAVDNQPSYRFPIWGEIEAPGGFGDISTSASAANREAVELAGPKQNSARKPLLPEPATPASCLLVCHRPNESLLNRVAASGVFVKFNDEKRFIEKPGQITGNGSFLAMGKLQRVEYKARTKGAMGGLADDSVGLCRARSHGPPASAPLAVTSSVGGRTAAAPGSSQRQSPGAPSCSVCPCRGGNL